MGKTNITHSLQARAVKPNSCMCKTCFAQKVIKLFTNVIIENSHPVRLEMKPNPLACSECPDLQNCALSSSFPQFPTNKMLPKLPPPLQSHSNGCVYGSCHDVPEATFNTLTSSGTLSQDLTWGMARMCPPEQAPQPGLHLAKQWHAMHRWPQGKAASHPGLGGSHGAAWAEHSPVGSPASQSLVCKLPSKGRRHSSNNTFQTTHGKSTSCLYCTTTQKSWVSHIPTALSPLGQHSPQHLHSSRSKLHSWLSLGRLTIPILRKQPKKPLRNPF